VTKRKTNWDEYGIKNSWPNLRYCPRICIQLNIPKLALVHNDLYKENGSPQNLG
jgi:hypothetical protein